MVGSAGLAFLLVLAVLVVFGVVLSIVVWGQLDWT